MNRIILRTTQSLPSSIRSISLQSTSTPPSSTTPTTSAFDSALSTSSSTILPTSSSTSSIPNSLTSLPPLASLLTPTKETELLSVLARLIMKSGKLSKAHSHLSICLSTLSSTTSSPPLPILSKAIEVVSPSIRIVGRRKGTKSLPTPQPLTVEQRRRQGWKWIVEASEKKEGVEKVFGKRLALEVLAVLNGQSEAIKKRDARHTQGVTGRANVPRG